MAKAPVGRYSSCSNHSKFNVDDGSMIESRRKRKFSSRDDCFVLTKSRYITKGSIFRFKRFEEKNIRFENSTRDFTSRRKRTISIEYPYGQTWCDKLKDSSNSSLEE